jgi:serine phosphatase RsbU (regulator of sigma subunit)
VGLFNEATYEDLVLELPPQFSLTLMSDGILDLLPGDTLKDKEAPCRNRQGGGRQPGWAAPTIRIGYAWGDAG